MDLTFIPYKEIGKLRFNATNDSAIKVFGLPVSQSMYGYPEKNKHLYEYGFFHVLSFNLARQLPSLQKF